MVTDPAVRWRLQVWDKAKKQIHDGTCVGDAELDAALRGFEGRPDFGRFSVAPESKVARPTVTTQHQEPAPGPPPGAPPNWPCEECNLPAPECRRREAVSGHTYIPTP